MLLKFDRIFNLTVANIVLMAFLLFTIFFVMTFPGAVQQNFYRGSLIGILFAAFYCIKLNYRRYTRWLFLITISGLCAYYVTGNLALNYISKSITICLYITIATLLVKQAASSRTVTRIVILESVNGYLMLAMLYAVIIALVVLFDPQAYNFRSHAKGTEEILFDFAEHLYYGFSAFTSATDGNITPASSVAKSVSMAIGFTGQMYLAIIIAMLVGKYSSNTGNDEN